MMAELYYSRPIAKPKDRREGLINFVQMIINAAERGDAREAMLLAVDLRNDLASKAAPYKGAL